MVAYGEIKIIPLSLSSDPVFFSLAEKLREARWKGAIEGFFFFSIFILALHSLESDSLPWSKMSPWDQARMTIHYRRNLVRGPQQVSLNDTDTDFVAAGKMRALTHTHTISQCHFTTLENVDGMLAEVDADCKAKEQKSLTAPVQSLSSYSKSKPTKKSKYPFDYSSNLCLMMERHQILFPYDNVHGDFVTVITPTRSPYLIKLRIGKDISRGSSQSK